VNDVAIEPDVTQFAFLDDQAITIKLGECGRTNTALLECYVIGLHGLEPALMECRPAAHITIQSRVVPVAVDKRKAKISEVVGTTASNERASAHFSLPKKASRELQSADVAILEGQPFDRVG
jgi:hypothetical protein